MWDRTPSARNLNCSNSWTSTRATRYVYAPDSPDVTRGRHSHGGDTSEIVDLLQTFQHSLDSKLQTVCAKLEDIDSRMENIESRQRSLEEQVRESVTSSASTSPGSELDRRRKRVTPAQLQVNYAVMLLMWD